jgi:hypothetical protein
VYLVDKQRKNIYNISHDNGYESINTSKYKLARPVSASLLSVIFDGRFGFGYFVGGPDRTGKK